MTTDIIMAQLIMEKFSVHVQLEKHSLLLEDKDSKLKKKFDFLIFGRICLCHSIFTFETISVKVVNRQEQKLIVKRLVPLKNQVILCNCIGDKNCVNSGLKTVLSI